MEEGKQVAVISQHELDQLEKEYDDYSKNAHRDLTHESDYQAALRVPAAFLKKPSNFEQTFDKILFHLDEAYRKSTNLSTKTMVSRTADDMFHKVICIIQAKLDVVVKENSKSFFQKIGESINKFFDNTAENLHLGEPLAIISASAAEPVGRLSVAFFDYLLTRWEIRKEESFFYNQLATVYQKILDAKSFNNEFGLIRNTFTRNKEDILTHVVFQKGVTAAKNLMKYDEKDSERQDSARIIVRALIAIHEWEKGAKFLHEVSVAKLINYSELKEEFVEGYKQFLKYVKSAEGKESPNKEIVKRYPTSDSIEYLIHADKAGYNHYMKRRKIKKWAFVASFATVITVILIIVGWQSAELTNNKKIYLFNNSVRLNEQWIQIEKNAANVDTLISEKKYGEAFKLISSGIIFTDNSGFADNYVSNANNLRNKKNLELANAILNEINFNVSNDMNNELYEYITTALIPLYSSTIALLSEEQNDNFVSKLETLSDSLDKSRDAYLERQGSSIEAAINNKDWQTASNLIPSLTHKSEKRRGPFYLNKYNEYWRDKKEEYKKKVPLS